MRPTLLKTHIQIWFVRLLWYLKIFCRFSPWWCHVRRIWAGVSKHPSSSFLSTFQNWQCTVFLTNIVYLINNGESKEGTNQLVDTERISEIFSLSVIRSAPYKYLHLLSYSIRDILNTLKFRYSLIFQLFADYLLRFVKKLKLIIIT